MTIEPVCRVLEGIGAHAMAARGYPRVTLDIDLLTTDDRALDDAQWAGLVATGAHVTTRRGDADDPLGGVVHVVLPDGTDIDVILAKWKWQAGVLDRAEVMTIAGSSVGARTGFWAILRRSSHSIFWR